MLEEIKIMTRKILVILAVLAVVLAVMVVSTEARRGGSIGGSGGAGGSGGGIAPMPNANYGMPSTDCGNYNGNYDIPDVGCGNYNAPSSICDNYIRPGNYDNNCGIVPLVAWVKTHSSRIRGGGGDGVAIDSDNNVYVTGGSYYGTQEYLIDYYTIKYDPDGNPLWAKRWNNSKGRASALGVAVDSDDNVIVTGGSGTIKYNSNGNPLWTVTYGGNGVATDSKDNVIVTRSSYSDYLTIKYDSDGNQLWNHTYDSGGRASALGVAVDSDDNVIVTGGSGTIKYNSNGNPLWTVTYGGKGGVAVDSDDNVIVTGYSSGTIKYNSNGNPLWTVPHGGDGGVATDSKDNVIVTGVYNYITVKYGPHGNILWTTVHDREFGMGGVDWAKGVAVDSDDNVIMSGTTRGDYLTVKYIILNATIDIRPDTLNLDRYGMTRHGRWFTAYIELPEGYDVVNINVSTVVLGDAVSAELRLSYIGDYDRDGIPDLLVKFNRSDVIDRVKALALCLDFPADVELRVAGTLTDGMPFEGSDTIRVIENGVPRLDEYSLTL